MNTFYLHHKSISQIRWLIRRDLKEVLDIEATLPDGWIDDDWLCCLKLRDHFAYVAEDAQKRIVGAMLIRLEKERIVLGRMIVHPAKRRQGIATEMIERLFDKLSHQRRREVTCMVPDDNLSMHLLLKSCGFLADSISTGEFGSSDGYSFVYVTDNDDILETIQ